jgi:hypothetical protein
MGEVKIEYANRSNSVEANEIFRNSQRDSMNQAGLTLELCRRLGR